MHLPKNNSTIARLLNRLAPYLDTDTETNLGSILIQSRERVLTAVARVTAVLGVFSMLVLTPILLSAGQAVAAIVFWIGVGGMWVIGFKRNISFTRRSYLLLFILYLASLTELLSFGLDEDGRIYLMTLIILATLLLGYRVGLVLHLAGVLTIALIGCLQATGLVLVDDPQSLDVVFGLSIGFLFMGGAAITALAVFLHDFELSWDRERQAAAALKAERSLLEQRVVERTHELAERNQELLSSREEAMAAKVEAEAASRAKSLFLANMSHEIRTPLNGIIGMTAVLFGSPLTDQQHEFVEVIQSSGETLLNVVNDILDFSKIESGNLVVEEVPFDLAASVWKVVELFEHQAKLKELELTCRIEATVPAWIVGDAHRLRQILINLVGNALKFTQAGRVALSVRNLPCDRPDHCRLQFAVEDTGIGITPEQMDRLFRPFSQVDPSPTRRYGGTGLGLAICHKLVEMLHGRIWVESVADQGSTFYFTIEALIHHQPQQPADWPTGSRLDADLARRYPLRILLAEDNPVNQKVALRLLTRLGYQADVATTGVEVLAAVEQQVYDLILMDVHMPDMDGLVTTRRLRERTDLPGPARIVAITASTLPEDRDRALEAGMDGFISKPIRLEELVAALQATIQSGEVPPDTSSSQTEKNGRRPAADV